MEKTNANVKTGSVTQLGNEELDMKEKNLYFLIIETPIGKLQINVGQKTHDEVKRLTESREDKTVIEVLPTIATAKEYAKTGGVKKASTVEQ